MSTILTSEMLKVTQALAPTDAAQGTVNGYAFNMREHDRILFLVNGGAQDATGTLAARVQECTDGLGSGAVNITNLTATATVGTRSMGVVVATTQATIENEEITITQIGHEGVVTKILKAVDKTAATVIRADGEFSSQTGNNEVAADMVLTVNALFPELIASAATNNVTIRPREPGKYLVSLSDIGTGYALASATGQTVQLEVKASDLSANFTHARVVAVTANENAAVSGTACMSGSRYLPQQLVSAAKRDTSA